MSKPRFAHLSRAGQIGQASVASAAIALAASALGYAAGRAAGGGTLPWLLMALATVAGAAIATILLESAVLRPLRSTGAELEAARRHLRDRAALQADLADRTEQQRRLRHDIRGALSPVLLVADRLLAHTDPAVQRSGDIMVRTVERATALLDETGGRVSPPSGS